MFSVLSSMIVTGRIELMRTGNLLLQLRSWILILVNFNFNLNAHMGLVVMVLGSVGQHITFLFHFTLLTALVFGFLPLPDSPKHLKENE